MPRYTYTGDQTVVFSHYLDVSDPEHPVTLVAEPGKTYEIKQADSPHVVQPDGQFTDQELPMPPSGVWEETDGPTWTELVGDGPFDPADHDVPTVLTYLDGVEPAERERVLDAEAAGKDRKGISDQRDTLLNSDQEAGSDG